MATLTKGKIFTSGESLTPTKLNDLVDKATISGIVNADISATAAIADTKLATIATAGKVSASAITSGNLALTGNATITGTTQLNGNLVVVSGYTISGQINRNWIAKTAAYTAIADDFISADTSAGTFIITLPSSPSKFDEVTVCDHAKTWDTNPLTIARNNKMIEGLAENLICDAEGKQFTLRYESDALGWRIYT